MIAVVRYNAGNVRSLLNALGRLGVEATATDDPALLREADRVIFPGVGEAGNAAAYLRKRGLDDVIRSLRQPFLGICLGLQLLCEFTEEGRTKGLGVFPVQVRRFPPDGPVPHVGWNNLTAMNSPLFRGVAGDDDVYFVHTYYAEVSPCTAATAEYLTPFSAALERENFHAVQFHPEKSDRVGLRILKNFLEL